MILISSVADPHFLWEDLLHFSEALVSEVGGTFGLKASCLWTACPQQSPRPAVFGLKASCL